jgi:hypothetical protein
LLLSREISAELDVAEFAHARNTDEIIADARK